MSDIAITEFLEMCPLAPAKEAALRTLIDQLTRSPSPRVDRLDTTCATMADPHERATQPSYGDPPAPDADQTDDHSDPRASASHATAPVDRYRDLGLLGSGGMGEVRRVYDPQLDRIVAMKILGHTGARQTQARQRFNLEATLTGGLQHPGIPPIYEQGTLPDGQRYFTMQEIRGQTFKQLL